MNQAHNFWSVSLLSILISTSGAFFIARYGHKFSLIDNPQQRSSHTSPTPRGGGIGIWIAFIGIGLIFTKNYQLILVPGVIGLMGFIDDRYSLSQRVRLIIQIILSFLSVYSYNQPAILPVGILLVAFWVVFITATANFYNFMDGINGIAGLTGVAGFGLMAFFSYYFGHFGNEYPITLMSISLLCACLGFLPLNFPNARVFMGDAGSLLLGFVFALFIVKLSSNIRVFLCLIMFLCTFYADASVTIFHRWKRGENLIQPHRRHLYQYLSNELGSPHWHVSLIYAGSQFVVGSVALFAYTKGLLWQITVFVVFSLLFLACYKFVKNMAPRFDNGKLPA
ncbi:MAG: glycosyltransferase family 4 protein [Nitrospirae bacterium]|nr:glycosyltransferase family 4 protein [Nitrospirota bacterium]